MLYIPLARGSKSPLAGKDWHDRISDDPAEIDRWKSRGLNLGLPLFENGRSVIDFDDKEAGRDFFRKHKELCTVMVETRRGIHMHYSGTVTTRKMKLNGETIGDIKGNGFVVFPQSRVQNWDYRLVELGPLLPYPSDVIDEMVDKTFTQSRMIDTPASTIRDVIKYIRRIRATSGAGGHNATFRVACKLRDAGVPEVEALALMVEWNETNAEPPWAVKDLLHKVRDAYSKTLKGQ